jgi:phosphoglucomutase
MDSGKLVDVLTEPILGMRPGTSGLRKKVEVWQGKSESNKHYVENFIQSLLDTAANENEGCVPDTILVAGDGRYFNSEAIQIICRVLAANGVRRIWVPSKGIMSTPAVSAAIRNREGGKCEGGIILTASHNPGGPGEDFGIKYNLGYGQPAGDDFTDKVSETKSLQHVRIVLYWLQQVICVDEGIRGFIPFLRAKIPITVK